MAMPYLNLWKRLGQILVRTGKTLTVNAPVTVDSLADTQMGATAATQKTLVVQGAASQTASIVEVQKSDGTIFSKVGPWGVQNTACVGRNTGDVTNATTTFANLADLTLTLVAGRKYVGRLSLKCINSTATDGVKFDFNGGTATATTFVAGGGVLASGGTDTVGTSISTSLAGVINFTVLTGETWIIVEFSIVVNAAGTFIPRFAGNTAVSGTVTLRNGSFLTMEDSPN